MYFDENNLILGIDAGSQTHGVVVFNSFLGESIYAEPALSLKELCDINGKFKAVIIEDYDQIHGSVGHEVLDTVRNIGRIDLHFKQMGHMVHLVGRGAIKKRLDTPKKGCDTFIAKTMREHYPKIKYTPKVGKHCYPALAAIHTYLSL